MAKGTDSTQQPAQIDYILCSNRYLSSVKNVQVYWGPSIHRFGHRWDHGLVRATWRFRLARLPKLPDVLDIGAMRRDEECVTVFDERVAAVKSVFKHWSPSSSSVEDYDQSLIAISTAMGEVLPTRQPKKGKVRERSARTLALFEERARQCQKLERGSETWVQTLKSFQKEIRKSCREDYRTWVDAVVESIRVADEKQDSSAVQEGVQKLVGSGASRHISCQPSKSKEGDTFETPEQLAEAWAVFAEEKFQRTDREKERLKPPDLGPSSTREDDVPTDAVLEKCLKRMKSRKAPGWDGIPVEIYQQSCAARSDLFDLVRRCWAEEEVPEKLVVGIIVPLYKNKGSHDDMKKYRFVCLLTHAYKLLSTLMLHRVESEMKIDFLPESQAGFRKKRGCRDNIFALSVLLDSVLQSKKECIITFIDYVAAFDSVAHRFLDDALGQAGASAKTRAMFRAVYSKAAAVVRVRNRDGSSVNSRPFSILRGVLQGDIFSPVCFIIAVAVVLAAAPASEGVTIGETVIASLEYADDAALANGNVKEATDRVSAVAKASRELADMIISIEKTEVMQVSESVKVGVLSEEELQEANVLKFKCQFCDRGFSKKRGMEVHAEKWCARRETYEERFEVERIVQARGPPQNRFYQIQWAGWPAPTWDQYWEPARYLDEGGEDTVDSFWSQFPEGYRSRTLERSGEHRCQWCCRFFESAAGLKSHQNSKKGCSEKPKKRGRSATVLAAERVLKQKAESEKEAVKVEGEKLNNVLNFKYLGCTFQSDGETQHMLEVRMAQARRRFGKLFNIWDNKQLSRKCKLQLYQSGVCSILAHGHEAWKLTSKHMAKLRGWNARCLYMSLITGNEIRDECREPEMDLVLHLRKRRLRWVGHLLREEGGFLARRAAVLY